MPLLSVGVSGGKKVQIKILSKIHEDQKHRKKKNRKTTSEQSYFANKMCLIWIDDIKYGLSDEKTVRCCRVNVS